MHYISIFTFLAGLIISSAVHAQVAPSKQTEFIPPINIPVFLSSNYGEYRSGHFHAGIDFKTQQTEGKQVLAADSGFVFRVVVSTGGYGNAVYLKHPSGLITLYGHLSSFDPRLAQYVIEQQYRKKSFTVDLLPHPGKFVYSKGAIIGLSGNSGTSFGPHLHFEVRDKTGAIPLNPLNYRFNVKDKTSPRINYLMLYPAGINSSIMGNSSKLLFKTFEKGNHYSIIPDTIAVRGKIGIGIETFDFLDNTSNKCGPYTVEMNVDNKVVYFCRMDSIPFEAGGYINSFFDYGENALSGKKILKLFVEPNNKLTIYKKIEDQGFIRGESGKVCAVMITVKDTYGNSAELDFKLQFKDSLKENIINQPADKGIYFSYDSVNVFEDSEVRIVIPRESLFDDIQFRYQVVKNDSFKYSSIHTVHDKYTPLFRPYILSIKPLKLPVALHDKAYIASRGNDGKWYNQNGEYRSGYITTKVKFFGEFVVAVDTLAPLILPVNFSDSATYSAKDALTFTISDTLTGIRKYDGYIDGNWGLFEYDAKNDMLTYRIDAGRIIAGRMHILELVVTDNRNNTTRYKSAFYY